MSLQSDCEIQKKKFKTHYLPKDSAFNVILYDKRPSV